MNSASDLPAGRQVSAKNNRVVNKMYYVYVLRSLKDGRLYKGMTQDVEKRLKQHNQGENRSTKGFIPWELVFTEKFKSRAEARKYEKYLKSGSGREFLKEIL
nr:GIY-YIG nuclease family protein [Zunongwangia pacifica]